MASDKWHIADTCEMKSDFSEKDDSSEGEFNSASEESESKKEKRKKKRKRKGLPKEIADNERLLKFWYQRYRLFSKFDEGIKLDEGLYYNKFLIVYFRANYSAQCPWNTTYSLVVFTGFSVSFL